MKLLEIFKKNKEASNAMWLIGGKVIQMILSLFVGVLSARYLGPSNYGLINYGTAYVSFFMALCTLGINDIIIKEFNDFPDKQGETLGTSLVLRIISSFLSAIMIFFITFILDFGETETIIVVILCSISLLFHAFDTINYWFQYLYKSKITAIATFIAYVATAMYKIILLVLQKNIFWFAFASSIDYIVLGVVLLIVYKKYNGPRFNFSWKRGKELLGLSYHYILCSLMISIYGQTDKLMLKFFMSETEVGYYSTAVQICSMWTFVLTAIISALYPTIIRAYKENKDLFERKNKQLYCIVFYVSFFVSICFLFGGELVVWILYGNEYLPASNPLRIITWYTAFSYLGVARNAWIVCEGKQRYLKWMYGSAAILNVIMNLIFIPWLGTIGAALASLITQISTSLVLPCFWKEMRPNAKLMIESMFFRGVFSHKGENQ